MNEKINCNDCFVDRFFSHNGYAESLLFTLDDGLAYDVSPLNDSNIDQSVLLISLHSAKFENDFWNFEGDDFSLDFLNHYNFELDRKDVYTSEVYDNTYCIYNYFYYFDEYLKYIKNNIIVSILFDDIYEIDVSPIVEFYDAYYSVPVASYSDDEGRNVVVIDRHIYEVPHVELSYRYGLYYSLNEFMNSDYSKSHGFESATINVNESSNYAISELSWYTSYTPSYSSEESPIPTPEPGTGLLVACGGIVFLGCFRRKIGEQIQR